MLFKEIKTWAKSHGYNLSKIKDGESTYYEWSKIDSDNKEHSGIAKSVSKVAMVIFNDLTDNKWVEHQEKFLENKEETKFSISNY